MSALRYFVRRRRRAAPRGDQRLLPCVSQRIGWDEALHNIKMRHHHETNREEGAVMDLTADSVKRLRDVMGKKAIVLVALVDATLMNVDAASEFVGGPMKAWVEFAVPGTHERARLPLEAITLLRTTEDLRGGSP